jgi:hypothetical protein
LEKRRKRIIPPTDLSVVDFPLTVKVRALPLAEADLELRELLLPTMAVGANPLDVLDVVLSLLLKNLLSLVRWEV